MGFKIPKNNVRIAFDSTSPYHGAEIVMSLDITIGKSMEIENLLQTDPERLVEEMVDLIVEWNLEDDLGQPLPVSMDSFREFIPLPLILELFNGFKKGMEGLVSVDDPFERRLKPGVT